MTHFTSPWADYKACWPVSEVAPLLCWYVKAPRRTDLHLFQGCLLPAETKLGLVYQQQLQQEGRLISTLAKCRCGDVYSREVIISVNNSLGNKEGGLPPPGHITISQMSKKTWYKVKDGWSESEVRCL